MLVVPASLSQAFETQLNQRNVPDQQRRDFHKWFRFYLDLFDKYGANPKLTASFAPFDEKLQSKGQSETQRQQARRAVAIYYRMVGAIKSTSTLLRVAPHLRLTSVLAKPQTIATSLPLAFNQQVPTFHTGAWIKLMQPLRRTPPSP